MKIKTGINYILRLFAIFALIVAAVPNSGYCAARNAVEETAIAAHSCCAPAAASCGTVLTVDCCCKPVPVNTAATPGLIAYSPTEFVQVSVLPQTSLPTSYFAAANLSRSSVIATASPAKIYIVHRALLI